MFGVFSIYVLIGLLLFAIDLSSNTDEKEQVVNLLSRLNIYQYILVLLLFSIFWLPLFIHVFFMHRYDIKKMLNEMEDEKNNKDDRK